MISINEKICYIFFQSFFHLALNLKAVFNPFSSAFRILPTPYQQCGFSVDYKHSYHIAWLQLTKPNDKPRYITRIDQSCTSTDTVKHTRYGFDRPVELWKTMTNHVGSSCQLAVWNGYG